LDGNAVDLRGLTLLAWNDSSADSRDELLAYCGVSEGTAEQAGSWPEALDAVRRSESTCAVWAYEGWQMLAAQGWDHWTDYYTFQPPTLVFERSQPGSYRVVVTLDGTDVLWVLVDRGSVSKDWVERVSAARFRVRRPDGSDPTFSRERWLGFIPLYWTCATPLRIEFPEELRPSMGKIAPEFTIHERADETLTSLGVPLGLWPGPAVLPSIVT
jgi:hypothetical protein